MSIEDKAQQVELQEWERNQKVPRMKTYKPSDAGYGPANCEECDDDMPDVRRTDGKRLCTACQTALERKKKFGLTSSGS